MLGRQIGFCHNVYELMGTPKIFTVGNNVRVPSACAAVLPVIQCPLA